MISVPPIPSVRASGWRRGWCLWLLVALGCERSTTTIPPIPKSGSAAPLTRPVQEGRLGGVVMGDEHACVWTHEGEAVCWGNNRYGELGIGTSSGHCRPILSRGASGVQQLVAGVHYTCARDDEGIVVCWGEYPGRGRDDADPLTVVPLKAPATTLAGAGEHACAITDDGHVWCWGSSFGGLLGFLDRSNKARPVEIPGITAAVALDISDAVGCVVESDGVVRCWGALRSLVADPPEGRYSFGATVMAGVRAGPALALVGDVPCAVRDDGRVACWDPDGAPLASDELAAVARGRWADDPSTACQGVDTDGDGSADRVDQCPQQPEVYNGKADGDGCPDQGPSLVEVDERAGVVRLRHKITFATGHAIIKPESFVMLEHLAAALVGYPRLTRIEIQVHSDSHGRDMYGAKPTQRRAQAVMKFLVSRGVEPERLMAKGYGEERPIDTNRTEAGRANNRRVEIHILEPLARPARLR
jgi:outer membrane protein OmpA-like peptidoglycan-associated protein